MADDTTTTTTTTDSTDASGPATGTEDEKGKGSGATDDDLGDAGKKALGEERRARRAAEKSAATAQAELDKIRQDQMTETERANARAEAAEKTAAEATARAVRSEVAREKGVPADLLSGTTQEELEASAAQLLKWAADQKKPADLKQGSRGSAADADPNQWLRDMAHR